VGKGTGDGSRRSRRSALVTPVESRAKVEEVSFMICLHLEEGGVVESGMAVNGKRGSEGKERKGGRGWYRGQAEFWTITITGA
jgi:hypothetical protein